MKKNVTAVEISHKYIKVVFGYIQNDQIYVDYVKKVPTNHFIENGVIKEKEKLIKELSRINPVVDNDFDFNRLINNVCFVLPPYGLEVYQTKQIVSVVSPERVIGDLDIRNIYSIIRNKKLPVDNDLVDIIPEAFAIDNGNLYSQAPIGKSSSAITALTKVHTLPRRINKEYSDILRDANIAVDRKMVSSFASAELLSTYPDTPENYFLVDIGSDSTSVSLVGKKTLFATRSFSWGGDSITDRIISSFNINEVEAEKIKKLFGLDKRQLKFEYPVSTTETEEGVRRHYVKELNELIELELDEFYKMMVVAIEQLAQAYNVVDYQAMPILLIGGGSKLKGLVPFLMEKHAFETIETVTPKTIGARDPSLFATLGAIYVDNKYPNTSEGELKTNVSVARED